MPRIHDQIAERIALWYTQHRRTLPWRVSKDPYLIWLSEVILQQTRVEQGIPYFLKFKDAFPHVQALANAEADHVMKLWQGLGYYSRARNLHTAAKQVATQHEGIFPSTYAEIIRLKGIGPYTAAAIASIAFEEPRAVVDGNVIRVVSRLFGIAEPVNESSVLRDIHGLADMLLNHSSPGEHNQAMMEFGAIHCTPASPACHRCPVAEFCAARARGMVNLIPRKLKKLKRKTRYLHYIIAVDGNHVPLRRRGTDDIWAGLYEFPLVETHEPGVLSTAEIKEVLDCETLAVQTVNPLKKHVLTHQDILATFYHVHTKNLKPGGYDLVKTGEVHTFALSRLIDRYLEQHELVSGSRH